MNFDFNPSLRASDRSGDTRSHRGNEAPKTKGTCDRCALSKVKCDRQHPHCARCVTIGEDLGIPPPCHYTVSLRSLKRRNGRSTATNSRPRSSTEPTQSTATPRTPELRTLSCSPSIGSGSDVGSDYGSTPPKSFATQLNLGNSTVDDARSGCADLLHACVRDMLRTKTDDSCLTSQSTGGVSLEQFLNHSRKVIDTFDTVAACRCTKASESALPMAYLLSTAFQTFRGAVNASDYRSRRRPELQMLRAELEKLSKLADVFNARYCEGADKDADAVQGQLLKYNLNMELKHCLDDLDRSK